MNEKENLDLFIKDCVLLANKRSEEKFLGWESLIAILIYQGIKLMLPEVKEWLKIGTEAIALKRQEIRKGLVDYASRNELDFPQAERAAEIVSQRLNEKTLKNIVKVLDK